MDACSARTAVVIPVYNARTTVERCLDSLSQQTDGAWQAWLVDDGSTDGTWQLLQRRAQADGRYRLVRSDHRGVAAARNLALEQIERTDAVYLTFLDADDYWEADMLACMTRAMEQTGADVVQCKYLSEYTDGRCQELKDLFPDGAVYGPKDFPRTVYWKMMTTIHMNHVCIKLYRTSLLRGRRFVETMPTAEDLLFNVDLFAHVRRYTYIARSLYHYVRDNGEGLTNTGLGVREKLRCNWIVSKRMLQLLPAWGMDTLAYRLVAAARPGLIVLSKLARRITKLFILKHDPGEGRSRKGADGIDHQTQSVRR